MASPKRQQFPQKQESAKMKESPKRKERGDDDNVESPTKRRYVGISKKAQLSEARFEPQTTTVIVKVGTEQKSWVIHKELLCIQSPYFAAAFNGLFQESTTNEVYLEHVSPEIFRFFNHWLYTERLGIPKVFDDSSPEGIKKGHAYFDTLVSCWILGDYLQVPDFQNKAMKCLVSTKFGSKAKIEQLPMAAFRTVYEETLDYSPLQRWVLDVWLRLTFKIADFKDPLEVFHPKMLLDVALMLETESKNIQAIAAKKAGFFDFSMDLPPLDIKHYLVEEYEN